MHKLFCLIGLSITISVSAVADSDIPPAERGPVTRLADGQAVVMALIANPGIGERLRKQGLIQVGRMTRQQIQAGVTEYVLQVGTCGNCLPKTGSVTITEDVRPTYMDGAIAYAISFQGDIQLEDRHP